ncbi:MAG TPA: isocitrate lyase/phosphoenolpyruvate mutase family protein [Puia sp.]
MVNQKAQAEKAERFRAQHLDEKLLVLPNIWDSLGAKLIQQVGFQSVATASVATALSNGYPDGEHIPFAELLNIVHKISSAVDLPLSVDFERGFADTDDQLKENIRLLIEHGGIGINIEDSWPDHKGLNSIADQCRKIEVIRETAIRMGIPLVINARTDIFFLKIGDNPMTDAIERARAFKKAGADCVYPIMINRYDDITRFVEEVEMPVNVVLLKPISDLQHLEKIGVARVSVGPSVLNHVLTVMKTVAEGLMKYDSSAFFGRDLLPREYLNQLV